MSDGNTVSQNVETQTVLDNNIEIQVAQDVQEQITIGVPGPRGPVGPMGSGVAWRGDYDPSTAYLLHDAVFYLGSSYACFVPCIGVVPTETSNWELVAAKGDTGADGVSDIPGPRGYDGTPGTKGDTGITGAPGEQGVQGIQGVQGQQGETGVQGIQGVTGDDSTVAGPKGDTGSQGIQGIQGETGAAGEDSTVAGPKGDTGSTGPAGTTAWAGIKDKPSTFAPATHNHVKADVSDFPVSMPASDVSTWAKEGTKPAYTPDEIGAEAVVNKSTSVPTDAASDTKYPSVKAVKDYADGLVAGLLSYRGAYDASGNAYPTTGGSGTAGAVMKGDMWAVSVAGTLGGVSIQGGDVIIAKINTPAQTAANWNALNTNISYVPEDQANKENTTLDTSTTKYPTNALVKTGLDGKASKTVSATDKILGRATAGAGNVEELACTPAGRALIDDGTAAAQLVTLGLTATAAELNKTDSPTAALQLSALNTAPTSLNDVGVMGEVRVASDGLYVCIKDSISPWSVGGGGVNLLTANQSNAETDATGMTSYGTLTRNVTTPIAGGADFKVVAIAGSAFISTNTPLATIVAGRWYAFQVLAKGTASGSVAVKVGWFASDGATLISESYGTSIAISATTQLVTAVFQAPSGAAKVSERCQLVNNAVGDVMEADSLMIEPLYLWKKAALAAW